MYNGFGALVLCAMSDGRREGFCFESRPRLEIKNYIKTISGKKYSVPGTCSVGHRYNNKLVIRTPVSTACVRDKTLRPRRFCPITPAAAAADNVPALLYYITAPGVDFLRVSEYYVEMLNCFRLPALSPTAVYYIIVCEYIYIYKKQNN